MVEPAGKIEIPGSSTSVENAEEPPDRLSCILSGGAEESCTYKRSVSLLPRPAIFDKGDGKIQPIKYNLY
jgi:hypothetical protein